MEVILLESCDGRIFKIDRRAVEKIKMIDTMLNDIGNEYTDTIQLNVDSNILEKIIKYCEHHKDDEIIDKCVISKWDKEFIGSHQETICQLVTAADYLNIVDLFNLCCKTFVDMMSGKRTKEIQQMLNIE